MMLAGMCHLEQALHEGDALGQLGLAAAQGINFLAASLHLRGGRLRRLQLRVLLLMLCLQPGHGAAQMPELQPGKSVTLISAT